MIAWGGGRRWRQHLVSTLWRKQRRGWSSTHVAPSSPGSAHAFSPEDDRERLAALQLLRNIHTPKEVNYYLKNFSQGPASGMGFAVIKIGGEVIERDIETLATGVSFLNCLGLRPILIHGAGPQLNLQLERESIEPRYVDGHRFTDRETLRIARRVFADVNLQLVGALERAGCPARPIQSGVFEAEVAAPGLGLVGEVTNVNVSPVLTSLRERYVPVLTCLGTTADGQVLNVNADVAARAIAVRTEPRKVIFLSGKGGWVDDDSGEILSTIDLGRSFDEMAARDYTGRQGTLLKLREIKSLLESLPRTSSVSITSPASLAKELFTHQGAGTFVTLGQRVSRYAGGEDARAALTTAEIDSTRLLALLESAFGHPTVPNYLEEHVLPNLASLFVSESYDACAIVLSNGGGDDGLAYLDKFAVSPAAQGQGLSDVLWADITRHHPQLCWRSKTANRANQWYFQRADGMARGGENGEWTVFWRGIAESEIARRGDIVQQTLARPATIMLAAQNTAGAAVSNKRPAAATSSVVKVGLLGARGHVGRELVRILARHPRLELVLAASRSFAGKPVAEALGLDDIVSPGGIAFENLDPSSLATHPLREEIGVWILALPNGYAADFDKAIDSLGTDAVTIDLSADMRFEHVESGAWVYGLPEKPGARELLRSANKIANPGCFATGAQLALMPLLLDEPEEDVGLHAPHVFGVSGFSGAGTAPSPKNDAENLRDNLLPYSLVQHLHEREISSQLGGRQIAFMPHVAPFFRGITLTVSTQLPSSCRPLPGPRDLLERFADFYAGESLVRVTEEAPVVRDNMGCHHAAIGGFSVDPHTGRVAVVATLDNLLKGAATQAVQNLNIALGMEEMLGIVEDAGEENAAA